MGGTLRAIETGFIQREIQQSAYEYQKGIETGERVVVGVNKYTSGEKANLPLLRIDSEIERAQVERLKNLRARRDAAKVKAALGEIETTARSDRNLLPAILAAVKVYATVGEISGTLRAVFGEYKESVVI
jgi:methylmalonyl-CoA mutase N-terminal domain/subunit